MVFTENPYVLDTVPGSGEGTTQPSTRQTAGISREALLFQTPVFESSVTTPHQPNSVIQWLQGVLESSYLEMGLFFSPDPIF